MQDDVAHFVDLQKMKSEVKAKVLLAVAAGDWDEVEKLGISSGQEKDLQDQIQEYADYYVDNHPELFAGYETMFVEHANKDEGHDALVIFIDTLRSQGLDELAAQLTMFELKHYERQKAGVTIRKTMRPVT